MEKVLTRVYKRRHHWKDSRRRGFYRVLLPLTSLTEAGALLPAARSIVCDERGELVILYVVVAPAGYPPSEVVAATGQSQQALNSFLVANGLATPQVLAITRVAQEVWKEIRETVDQLDIDLVILGWHSDRLPEIAMGQPAGSLPEALPQDLVVIRSVREGALPGAPRPILAPDVAGANPRAAARTGVAAERGALRTAPFAIGNPEPPGGEAAVGRLRPPVTYPSPSQLWSWRRL